MRLPSAIGGEELSVLDQALIKEAIYASGSPFAPHDQSRKLMGLRAFADNRPQS